MPTPLDPRAQTWLARFRALRADQDSVKGSAPHKPLLLLAVLDLFEGAQPEGQALSFTIASVPC